MTLEKAEQDFVAQLSEPFRRLFLERQKEQYDLFNLICSSLNAMVELPELFTRFNRGEKVIQESKVWAELAKKEIEKNFSSIASQSIIVLWGALEAAVRDFSVNWLLAFPHLLEKPSISSIKVRLGDFLSLTDDDRARFIIAELERSVAAKLKPGVGRFEAVLEQIDLAGGISDKIRRDILELSAIRNVLVHNAGHADAKFLKLCPWLDICVGDALTVSPDDYRRYMPSVLRYSADIIDRAGLLVGSNDSFKPTSHRGVS